MKLSDVFDQLKALAAAEWERIKAEGIAIEQKIVAVEQDTLGAAVEQFGAFAMQTITGLMTAEWAHLTGTEKNNLAVTTLIDKAEQDAKKLLHADAAAIVKNGFVALSETAPAIAAAVEPLADSVAESLAEH